MGFFDRLDNYMTGPQRRASDLANEENALRLRQAQRQEENLLRRQGMANFATSPSLETAYPEMIAQSQQRNALDRADPEAAMGRLQSKLYPQQKAPISVAANAALVDPETNQEIYRNRGPEEAPDLSKQFKQMFGTDVPTGYAPVTGPDGMPTGDVRPLRGMKDPAATPKDTFGDEAKLRGEFDTKTNEFGIVRNAYSAISEFEKNPSAAGDISLVFQFMKLQDPNSSVREGEYANAENAAGVPARLRNLFNKVKDGSFLTPQQRADFVGQSGRLYDTRLKQYKSEENRYRDLAKRYGLDPEKITYDRSGGLAKSTATMPKVGEVQDGYRFNGGDPAFETSWVKVK
jgi:hypothetical protein